MPFVYHKQNIHDIILKNTYMINNNQYWIDILCIRGTQYKNNYRYIYNKYFWHEIVYKM